MTQRFYEVRAMLHQLLDQCDDQPDTLSAEDNAAYYELVTEYNQLESADWVRGNQFGYSN